MLETNEQTKRIWHRNKAAAAQQLKKSVLRVESEKIEADARPSMRVRFFERKSRRSFLKKASHRHFGANEKKRYEYRVFYEEFGEIVGCSF